MNLLKISEVAKRLSVSAAQVYRLIHSGELPVVNVGVKCYRIAEDDLATYVEKMKCQSIGIQRRSGGALKLPETVSAILDLFHSWRR